MPPTYKQKVKPIRITTPAGDDVLLIQRMKGTEHVSTPFVFVVDMLSTEKSLDPKKLLRKSVTIEMDLPDGSVRYINGIMRRFVQLGRGTTFTTYRAEIVPTIWLLSLSADCRVFQAKKVGDIVKQVLDDMGVKDYKLSLSGTYPTREYCVQYRETHLDFISRLMEEEGIYYFFEHAKDKHTLVLADAPTAMKPGPVAKLEMSIVSAGKPALPDTITELEVGSEVTSGKVTLVDYNDTMPKKLEGTTAGTSSYTAASIRVFDYPGKFDAVSEAERVSRLVMAEREALVNQIKGKANVPGIISGFKLEVAGHYRGDVNATYQILSVDHDAWITEYETVPAGTPDFVYTAQFTGIPQAVPYRPPHVTPRSIVHGSQTALVVGPSGEEIYVDKYGRVKVQFFWDQLGKSDENSSCWMRVSSAWAGKNWGFIQIPRIGQEVIVDFLEGDPDRPIVTGRVYNAELMPPYALPDNGTQSGLKTRSSKQGGASDANELRFEDKKASEEVFLHSQKDFNAITENNETWTINKGNRTTTIKKGNDATTITEGDQTLDIKKGKQTVTIKDNRTTTIESGDEALTVKTGKMTTEVSQGDHTLTVKMGKMTTDVQTGNVALKVGKGNLETNVDMGNLSETIKLGNVTIKASLGKVSIEAMQGIELKVGANTVTVDQSGVTVKGIKVGLQGTAMIQAKAPMAQVTADGMLTLKGGVTMIN